MVITDYEIVPFSDHPDFLPDCTGMYPRNTITDGSYMNHAMNKRDHDHTLKFMRIWCKVPHMKTHTLIICSILMMLCPVCLNATLIVTPTDEGKVVIRSEYRSLCQGEVVKISLQSPVPVSAVLSFDGHEYPFVSDDKRLRHFSLIALGLDMEPGIYDVVAHLESSHGMIHDIPFKLALSEKSFPTKRITVARRFTSPVPADMRRIQKEEDLLRRIYGKSSLRWLGNGRFIMPLEGKTGSLFGEQRIFNEKVVSRHRGIDIRSPHGASITASNSGEVVLARDLYYSGNTVIIDHGIGLFSIYCHMSKIRVREGAFVGKGEPIGYTGSTGRSTGPHLHWGLKLAGIYADPLSILALEFD